MLKNLLIILFLIFLLIVAISFLNFPTQKQLTPLSGNFSILNISRIGNYAYAIFSYVGQGNVTLLAYDQKPSKEVFILNEKGIGMSRLEEFVSNIRILENKGFSVNLNGTTNRIDHGIYIIPTGAMPFYVFDNLAGTSATIIYIGKKDLFLEAGNVKNRDWYSELSPKEKSKLIIYEKTLDQLLENKTDILSSILENSWTLKNKKSFYYQNGNKSTASILLNGIQNGYMRVVYDFGDNSTGIIDSSLFQQQLVSIPKEINFFPNERFDFQVNLNKTNGTVYIVIEKDGGLISRIKELRIVDAGVIYEELSGSIFKEPGDYVIKVEDNSGTIGGTIAHVKKLNIILKEKRTRTFVFSVLLDNVPLDKTEAEISLNNGTYQNFTINNGELIINARLSKGSNIFYFKLFSNIYKITVENTLEDSFDVYFKIGIPGLILVIGVYIFAKLSRKPTYVIRIAKVARDIRKELKLSVKKALELFKITRKELKLFGPITAQEFGFTIKRHFTEGADITEGNIEEILKELSKQGFIEHKRDYYQLKEDGDLGENVIKRIIREKLIERGINFTFNEDKFQTSNYEIGFFNSKFSKKAIVVYDNERDFQNWFVSLSDKTKAAIRIKQFNGSIDFMSIDKIDDVL